MLPYLALRVASGRAHGGRARWIPAVAALHLLRPSSTHELLDQA
jgi:hypothetical protein